MNYISFKDTKFEFRSSVGEKNDKGFFESEIIGEVPIPKIIKTDRIILPIDEGIAIDADGDYEDGEFSFDSISHHFCGRIDRAMFGIFFKNDGEYAEKLYKDFGYICTQYDNYSDCLNPERLSIIPNNRVKNCDCTERRMKDYPDGISMDENGNLRGAWALKGFDGKMYSQNRVCPYIGMKRMKEEVPEVLKKYPYYKGRFVDVYGGSIEECFNPKHPVTLEECVKFKKQAFENLEQMGLIAGTEDGFEDIIDSLVYTEGLHSPVYFRNKDSGRRHANMYNEKERKHIEKQMLSPKLRIPLWQMVYHENLLSFPYWGDSTDDSVEQIKDKILFACLFGCPPLYSFSVSDFEKLKQTIVSSYKKISKVNKKTAAEPITDYRVLNDDFTLQQTVFGNKYSVTANFSDIEQYYNGEKIPPKDFVFKTL